MKPFLMSAAAIAIAGSLLPAPATRRLLAAPNPALALALVTARAAVGAPA